jgi:hypothetical protein
MRFPFTFMGVVSLVIGLWIFIYLVTHQPLEPFSGGLALATAFINVAFGSFVVARRLRRGPDG